MAGEFKYTTANDQTVIKSADSTLAEAYCQGRAAQVAGVSSNPFPAGSEQNISWQYGHDQTTPAGLRDNCALAVPIAVPNLSTMSLGTATSTLVAAGLAIGKITQGPIAGTVLAQSPTSAALAQPHDVIAVTLSVTVPDLTGMSSVVAQAAIIAAGLIVGTITGTSGVVTTQNPAAASLALPNASVAFTIA